MDVNQNFGVAIHILVCLDSNSGDYVTSNDIAQSVNTNPVVVRRILRSLAFEGLVITKKGKFGSKLSKKADEITLLDVYNVFYKGNILNPTHNPNPNCPIGKKINHAVSSVLGLATNDFKNTLNKYTISSIKLKVEKGE